MGNRSCCEKRDNGGFSFYNGKEYGFSAESYKRRLR